jgi:glutamine amidotransferase
MCRLAAYLGKEITLSVFLQEHEHSLIQQSWAPKEMQGGTLNADGYGVSWLSNENKPCTYKNVLPIWSDTNLDSLGRSLASQLWLANVRSATIGQGISEANTQPFSKDNLIFTHNGSMKPFNSEIKARFLDILPATISADINGDSDSLHLFALLKLHLLKQDSLANAIIGMLDDLKIICNETVAALLNIIISDGDMLYACRHALNGNCPSLYYLLKQDGIWIASEPLSQKDAWTTIPNHKFIIFNHTGVVEEYDL